MRRLLYSLVFVSVLLLAGSAVLAEPAVPDGGGTVPDGDYQVWLPVVGRGLTLFEQYPFCAYLINPISPPDEITVRAGDPVTFTFNFENQNMGWPGNMWSWKVRVLTTTVEPPYAVGGESITGTSDDLNHSERPITIVMRSKLTENLRGRHLWQIMAGCGPYGNDGPPSVPRSITFE